MSSPSNKKLSILYTLQVLRDYSDENHLLSQADIALKIEQKYGMVCERKSIGTNIDSLIDFGYDIVKTNAGSFLASREFEPSEIKFLVDAVFSSKSINSKHSRELSEKLSEFLSVYQRKQYRYIYKADDLNRSDNKQLFYNIDVINDAIEKNRQITFKYNSYGIDGKLTPKKNGKDYLVNPYFMVNSQGKYYLVCNYDYYDTLGNYKIEQITDIKMTDKPRKPISENKDYEENFDIAKYINQNVYMFSSKTIKSKIKLDSCFDSTYIHEFFADATIKEENGKYYAYVKANEDSIIYWCIQYGDVVELVEPQDVREYIINELHKTLNKYKRGNNE